MGLGTDFRTKCASFVKKNEKSVQKLAKVRKSWYVLSRNWQKSTLFGPLFCTPLRKLFEVDSSYLVCGISCGISARRGCMAYAGYKKNNDFIDFSVDKHFANDIIGA